MLLLDLDVDVIIQVLALLDVHDILILRLTSKHFASLTYLRTVWHNALVCHVLSRDIPVVRTPHVQLSGSQQGFTSFSAMELERVTRAALAADRKWRSGEPTLTRTTRINSKNKQLYSLRFLTIRNSSGETVENDEGRYLMSYNAPWFPQIQVWDVETTDQDAQDGVRLAGEWSENGLTVGMAVDDGSRMREPVSQAVLRNVNGALIAVSTKRMGSGAITFALHILYFTPPQTSSEPHYSMHKVKSFSPRAPVNVWALSGRLVALQVFAKGETNWHRHGILKVADWVRSTAIFTEDAREGTFSDNGESSSQTEVAAELVPSTYDEENLVVLDVRFAHDCVLVFRETVLEMYFVPSSALRPSSPETRGHAHALRPVAVHKWSGKVDSVAVTERVSWAQEYAATQCTVCDRRGYVLNEDAFSARSRNSEKDEEENKDGNWSQRTICVCQYRPLSLVVTLDCHFLRFPFEHFVLHVPSCTVSAVSPALTDRVPPSFPSGDFPAPALDRFGTFLCVTPMINYEEAVGERVVGRRLLLSAPSQFQDVSPPKLDAETVASRERAMAMPVFASRPEKGWCALALCERAGRIVVGYEKGSLELRDYF
ncbi:hypothetical protein M0805_008850 [Coniferiporia weirii]|nr:hypothetical protein M0805_008850 [Coniferiporia weirii]